MRFWDPTCLHFGTKLAPQIQKTSTKMEEQDASFFASILASVFVRFVFQLGAQVGPMLASFAPLDAPKNHKKKYQKIIQTLKTAQDASWTPPGPLQTSILVPLDLDLRRILASRAD